MVAYLPRGQLVQIVYISTIPPSSCNQMFKALITLAVLFLLSTFCLLATVKEQKGPGHILYLHFVLILILLLFYLPMPWSCANRINFYYFCLYFWQSCGNTDCSSDFIETSFILSSLLLLLCNFVDKIHFIRTENMLFSTWVSYLRLIFERKFKPNNKK